MAILRGKYSPHLVWLIAVVAIFALILFAINDGRAAAMYVNGIMANLFDPLVWLIALLPAIKIKRNTAIFFALLCVALLVVSFKLYMRLETGSDWIAGSIAGNVVGFVTVGYIINAIAVARRSRSPKIAAGGA